MALLPSLIPSRIFDFTSLHSNTTYICRRQLQFGSITLSHITHSPSEGMYIGAQQIIVARHCGVPLHLRWRSPGSDMMSSKLIVPGTVHIKSASEQFWQRWLFPANVLVIAFEKAFFEKLSVEATGTAADFVGELGVTDAALSDLTTLLNRELLGGGLNGRFYVENLGAALAAYLVQRRAGKPVCGAFREARLASSRLRRVIEYIDTHLDDGLGLDELSAVAGLNVHHFAHAFKATTGIPPHRFIIDRRVQTARSQLETTKNSIADIALACGFASQSHFTEVFRRVVGLTPAQYRRRF